MPGEPGGRCRPASAGFWRGHDAWSCFPGAGRAESTSHSWSCAIGPHIPTTTPSIIRRASPAASARSLNTSTCSGDTRALAGGCSRRARTADHASSDSRPPL